MTYIRRSLLDDARLHRSRQLIPDVLGAERAVQQERAALAGSIEHLEALEEAELVAGDEIGLVDQIWGRIGSGPKRRCETVTEPDFFES